MASENAWPRWGTAGRWLYGLTDAQVSYDARRSADTIGSNP
ncbi:hypothetical protein OG948_19835 [Embleya sp. NBC_00888]|nr:hypothetical protein OG948_19835 [Embleya sp. NBC_00888]